MMCAKCTKLCGLLTLLVGIGLLLVDTGVWRFWGLQWWTLAFVLIGLCAIVSGGCPDCQACCEPKAAKKR